MKNKTEVILDSLHKTFPDNNSPFDSKNGNKLIISEINLNEVPIVIHLVSPIIEEYKVFNLIDTGKPIIEFNLSTNISGIFYLIDGETENKASFKFEII